VMGDVAEPAPPGMGDPASHKAKAPTQPTSAAGAPERPPSPAAVSSNPAWDAAKAKPWDFDVWMALIQPLEKAGKESRADLRLVYQEFLEQFPLCYGYWDKLARLERSIAGGAMSAATPVYERGIAAVKCWELYLKYCGCAMLNCGVAPDEDDQATEQTEDEKVARTLFARAVSEVGGVYNSAKLWDAWYAFELARPKTVLFNGVEKTLTARLAVIAMRACTSPVNPITATKYLEIFGQTLFEADSLLQVATAVMPHLPADERELVQPVLSSDEGALRAALRASVDRCHGKARAKAEQLAPYEDKVCGTAGRPYFHVKPLSAEQKGSWEDYIAYAISQGNKEFITFIFDRALIAVASYPEFWLRYASYLASVGAPEEAKAVLKRGCTKFFKRRTTLVYERAMLEETMGYVDEARATYEELLSRTPSLPSVQAIIKLTNLERRAGNIEKSKTLYAQYIASFYELQEWQSYVFLSLHYASMLAQVARDALGARQVYVTCTEVIKAAAHSLPDDAQMPRLAMSVVQAYVSFEQAKGGVAGIELARAAFHAALEEDSGVSLEDRVELHMDFLDFEHDRGDVGHVRAQQIKCNAACIAGAVADIAAGVTSKKRRRSNAPEAARPSPAATAAAAQAAASAAVAAASAQAAARSTPYPGAAAYAAQQYYGGNYHYGQPAHHLQALATHILIIFLYKFFLIFCKLKKNGIAIFFKKRVII